MGHFAEDQVLQSLDEAMVAYHRAYGRTSLSRLHQEDDCFWYESSIGFSVFGGVIRSRFAPDKVDRRIEELLNVLRGQPHHWFVMPTTQPQDLAERIIRTGGENIAELTGMVMDLNTIAPSPPLPIGIDIRPVDDDASVREYARVYALLFEAPTESWVNNLANAEVEIFHSGHDHFHRYLAYENGRAIAAGMTCSTDRVATLETLSTLPECRNRGVGAALATQALNKEGENGAQLAVVWSSPGARRLYSRMGFRYVCTGNVLAF
jgi:GNAT superfamily N-acetyltransferase